MKDLRDFEKELSKCSKCGLCQSVCPIYKITQNECCVSKGKFIMLHGVTKGDLKLSSRINKYLDLCLKCGKCENFCPAEIDVIQIFNYAKFEYNKKNFFGRTIFLLQNKILFNLIIKAGKLFSKIFRKKRRYKPDGKDILYFKGCVNEIFPNTDRYLYKILKNTEINVICPDFDCCGLPFLSEGNIKRFIQSAKNNLEKIENSEFKYIVTDCASCQSTLLNYSKYLPKTNIENLQFADWGEIISKENLKFKFKNKIRVTFHKPCHLEDDKFFYDILKNCENIEYVKMQEYDACCGFAGSFFIKNLNISKQLMKNKGQNITDANVDYVVTTCPSCMLGLRTGLKLNDNKKTKVVSLLELLAQSEII